jgi:geranylgeranyl reductase family protein
MARPNAAREAASRPAPLRGAGGAQRGEAERSSNELDVLIVGGGPAGSSLAWGLRESGLRVVVMDRARFPRDKTCAGWVTPPVWRALALDPDEYAKSGRTLQPIRGFQIGRSGGAFARAIEREVVSHGIRRCEFDAYLLERCGAELRLGEAVREIAREPDGWRVNGTLRARLLVGAGGHFCPVARALMQGRPKEMPIAAQEIEAPLSEAELRAVAVDPLVPEIWFTRDLAGYGWVFRKGDYLNVGLGRRGGEGLSEELRAFLAELRATGRIPESWGDGVHGHAYLTYAATHRPLTGDRVALLGDAAGLAYPKSGEGIRPAVESGLLLARALLGARSVDDAGALAAYERAVLARFGPRLVPGDRAGGPVPGWQAAFAGKLFATPAFARRVVVRRWFLQSHGPPLLV